MFKRKSLVLPIEAHYVCATGSMPLIGNVPYQLPSIIGNAPYQLPSTSSMPLIENVPHQLPTTSLGDDLINEFKKPVKQVDLPQPKGF